MPESSEFSEEFGKSVAIESYGGSRSATASRRNYLEIEPNITIRDEYTSQDYYKFRPSEDIDGDCKPIMKKCQKAYSNVGLIKQVIDLMGDFASQGVRISHPNKSIERFYKRFWTKVDGDRISEWEIDKERPKRHE
jgi:hypothetical protein